MVASWCGWITLPLRRSARCDRPAEVLLRARELQHSRAAHELAARATDAYESARDKVRGFLNAGSSKEIVFVRGATEAD